MLGTITNLPQLQQIPDLQLSAVIAQGEYITFTDQVLRSEKFYPAWELPADHAFVQQALQGIHAAGMAPQLRAYRFCTNAAYSAGVAGVPTIGFGPAEEGDAHVVNEHLQIAELTAVARGYQGIIEAVLS